MGPFKGIDKDSKDLSLFVPFSKNQVMKHSVWAFTRGFRKVREACRNHFHLSWYLSVPVVTSDGPKPSWGEFLLSITICRAFSRAIQGYMQTFIYSCFFSRLRG